MNVDKFKSTLKVLQGVDIKECTLIPSHDGVQIRGINEEKTIIVFTTVPDEIVDSPVGILSVRGVTTRLDLFDQEKVGVQVELGDEGKDSEYIRGFIVKEGRRRSKITTTKPTMLAVPNKYPDEATVLTTFIDGDYADYLSKLKTSINSIPGQDETFLTISTGEKADSVQFKIKGQYDDFTDQLDADINTDFVEDGFSATWKIDSVMRVIKKASSLMEDKSETMAMSVNAVGVLEVDVGGLIVSVTPTSVG